jgi:hypothetical protein
MPATFSTGAGLVFPSSVAALRISLNEGPLPSPFFALPDGSMPPLPLAPSIRVTSAIFSRLWVFTIQTAPF